MLNIALIGNPNSGKTTLFNRLTGSMQYTGNRAGVTISKKEGLLIGNQNIHIVDLPGVYSTGAYTKDEGITDSFLRHGNVNLILNVVDSTHLERSLYLTTELAEYPIPMLIILNMSDIAKKRGVDIQTQILKRELNCDILAVSAYRKTGLDQLVQYLNAFSQSPQIGKKSRPPHFNPTERYRYIESFIRRVCPQKSAAKTNLLDSVVTNRYLSIPIFIAVFALIFYWIVFKFGNMCSSLLQNTLLDHGVIPWMQTLLGRYNIHPLLSSLLFDGVFTGLRAVIGFLPQMTLLFFALEILEDCGYIARIAFVTDGLFSGLGLSGKSFIPLILGCGCSAGAVFSTRTIEDLNERKRTITTASFIPCSAKLPIILLISTVFFKEQAFFVPLVYFFGFSAVLLALPFLKKRQTNENKDAFILELPDYRIPSLKNAFRFTSKKVFAFLKKAGSLIVLSSIIIWFGSNFDFHLMHTNAQNSILASIGKCFSFVFVPLGFGNWQAVVACFCGLLAKENIVGTLAVMLGSASMTELQSALSVFFTPAAAVSFLIFNLLCPPCIAAISAIKEELGSIRSTIRALLFQSLYAYSLSFLVYSLWTFFSHLVH